jgi:fructokinase
MPDVVCLGEALIDLFADPIGVSLQEADHFVGAPGGAPANVAVGLARLGVDVGFVGCVGRDPFGARLIELLRSEGVDTRHFRSLPGSLTTLAIVAAYGVDQRDFVLYRGADTLLRPEDLDLGYIASARVFHYGSVTLSAAGCAAAAQAAAWAARCGVLVAYDANLRLAVWPSPQAARDGILAGVAGATICKLNETELELLAGTTDLAAGSRWILDHGPRLCLVTLGPGGAYFANGRAHGHVPGFCVDGVDATGCGDGFLAGLICGLLETSLAIDDLDEVTLWRLVEFANAVGALTATCEGAMAALPHRAGVEAFLRANQMRREVVSPP